MKCKLFFKHLSNFSIFSTIPELPEGRVLELRLLSNWGDSHYIGLNSVEIFTSTGERAVIDKVSVFSEYSE